MDVNNDCKGGDGLIDRSKVRILLCDNDAKSLKEVFTLLSQCSYQVISVRSARQVIDALTAEGPDIDMILAEVDLPMTKGMKMLKYITRDKDLRRIPVIMMSRQDEVPVVVKCLKLGAADYLVKPLRTNELLNLWTHMWRRRRMLGLVEKNILSYDFDLAGSDPSDANTNSTTLFSDETDDKMLRCTNAQTGTLDNQENECAVAAVANDARAVDGTTSSTPAHARMETSLGHLAEFHPHEARRESHAGQFSSTPKKSKLKIGESSAFITYVKSTSTVLHTTNHDLHVNDNGSHHPRMEKRFQTACEGIDNNNQECRNGESLENNSHGEGIHGGITFRDSIQQSCMPPMSNELLNNGSQVLMNPINESSQAAIPGFSAQTAYPYYMHGVMNQVMMQSSAHSLGTSAVLPQYGHHLPHCPPNHPSGMPSFPYCHPVSISLQHSQMSVVHHSWPPAGNMSSNQVKPNKIDRREEALIKFRRKRNQRCFNKKIRYVNRKRLAERRPRVRGQFVRKMNGVNVDLNGQPDSADCDDDEEEEEEDRDSSP